MKRIWPVIRIILILWGLVCLIAAISVAGYVTYWVGSGNKESAEVATKRDVRFVLNWCELGDERIEEVLHSYVSARSFTGDHLDAHAIRISNISESELTKDEFDRGWTRCDQTEGVLSDALELVSGWLYQEELSWFLSREELTSSEVFVYPWSIYCHGTRPTATELIFIRPSDRMVFYFSCKM